MFCRAKKQTATLYEYANSKTSERSMHTSRTLLSPSSQASFNHTGLVFSRTKSNSNLLRHKNISNSMALHGHRVPRGFSERSSPEGKSDFSFSNASLRHGQQGKPRGGQSSGEEPTSVRFLDHRPLPPPRDQAQRELPPATHCVHKQDFLAVVKLLIDYINNLHAKQMSRLPDEQEQK